MEANPGPSALRTIPTKHGASSIKNSSQTLDIASKNRFGLNWTKILASKGLESPGYEEAVVRARAKQERRKQEALELRQEKAKKKKGKGAARRRSGVR